MSETVGCAEVKSKEKTRIILLDEVRGFAVICMVIYHALYTLGYVFEYTGAVTLLEFFMPLEPIFAAAFIYISGICTKLSRSNLRRGAILLVIALGVNLFTAVFIPSFVIAFGVLNLLSVCMIFYGLFGKALKKLNPILGFGISLAIFSLTWGITDGFVGFFSVPLIRLPKSIYSAGVLFPFGFKYPGFYSSDYFPIFPWFFAFTAGAFSAEYFSKFAMPKGLCKSRVPFFASAGRHALIIYIAHQPIIFILAYIIKSLK